MLEFPSNPADGETVYQSDNGVTYQWNAADTRWESGGTTGSSLVSGTVVQSVMSQRSDSLNLTGTIPNDNTKPQITEGTEFFSVPFTPKYASSKIQIELVVSNNSAIDGTANTFAVFDGNPDAIGVGYSSSTGVAYTIQTPLLFQVDAASINSRTYSVRGAVQAGPGSLWLNSAQAATPLFDGILFTTIRITEIQPNAVVPAPNAFNDYLAGYENNGLSGTGINELDDIAVNSMYLVPPAPVNAPLDYIAGSGGFIVTMAASPNGAVQYIYGRGDNSGKQWTRTKTAGVWSAWKLMVDANQTPFTAYGQISAAGVLSRTNGLFTVAKQSDGVYICTWNNLQDNNEYNVQVTSGSTAARSTGHSSIGVNTFLVRVWAAATGTPTDTTIHVCCTRTDVPFN